MGNEKVLMKSEERKSLAEVAAFLRDLADRFEQNSIVFHQGSDEVALSLPDMVTLEIKIEEEIEGERTEKSLEVEIEWVENEGEQELRLG